MRTIFDQHGLDLSENDNLSAKEMKDLFELLNKLDPETMKFAISYFGGEDDFTKEDLGEKYYVFAIGNFFSIQAGGVVEKHFGEDITNMCQETEETFFKEVPFVKLIKTLADTMNIDDPVNLV